MQSVLKKLVLSLAMLLLFPASAYCEQLSTDQATGTKLIQSKLAVVKDLVDHQLITALEAEKARNFYCQQAMLIVGHAVSAEQIDSLTSDAAKTEGFGVFLNSVIILAGITLLLSAIGLVTYYLRDLLRSLPSRFYECASYIITGILLSAGFLWQPFNIWFLAIQPLWFIVPGAFAFAGCVYLSYYLHWLRPVKKQEMTKGKKSASEKVYLGPGFFTFPTVLFGLCTIVWGATAIIYHQAFPNAGIPHFLAFISVMALQSFLGFSIITAPGCIALGWDESKKVPKSTLASLVLLIAYVGTVISGNALPEIIKLFETGCLFMGAFVYYLGLLIMSSKWYCRKERYDPEQKKVVRTKRSPYMLMQAITVASGVAAFYLGSSFHIGTLLGIGGTFFVIYFLEKYYEIPWKGVGWAWSLLGVATALYFFVGFAGQYPQYFVWGIH